MKGNLFIISAPSGGGKGTLIREVIKNVPRVGYSVSSTTRQIRQGETDGREYVFVSRPEFEKLIAEDKFLEYAEVHGNYYGTSRDRVDVELEAGNDVILEIDIQGAEIIRRKVPDCVSVFILPPSFTTLKKRLEDRSTESNEDLEVRLNNAKQEVRKIDLFDYIVINDDIRIASNNLIAIFQAERLRRDRQRAVVRDILNTFEIDNID